MLLLVAVLILPIILSGCAIGGPNVKKSSTGICHAKGTSYYEKTKKFTAFDSLEQCLSSGGRAPKK
jgi:hypothetical protein